MVQNLYNGRLWREIWFRSTIVKNLSVMSSSWFNTIPFKFKYVTPVLGSVVSKYWTWNTPACLALNNTSNCRNSFGKKVPHNCQQTNLENLWYKNSCDLLDLLQPTISQSTPYSSRIYTRHGLQSIVVFFCQREIDNPQYLQFFQTLLFFYQKDRSEEEKNGWNKIREERFKNSASLGWL